MIHPIPFRFTRILPLSLLLICLMGCTPAAPQPSYTSPEQVTIEELTHISSPASILEHASSFTIAWSFAGTGQSAMDEASITNAYRKEGDIIYANILSHAPDAADSIQYYSTDPQDTVLYTSDASGNQAVSVDAKTLQNASAQSFLNYDGSDAAITEAVVDGDSYRITVAKTASSGTKLTDTILLDPQSGHILEVVSAYPPQADGTAPTLTCTCTYNEDVTIDDSPKTGAASDETDDAASADLFDCTDINGEPLSRELVESASVIMLNLWEPWCGPCVGEMPDLQKLYETYKDKGLLILGAYTTFSQDEAAASIVRENGITYPIIRGTAAMEQYQTGYVPSTWFFSPAGIALQPEPYPGAHSYEEWDAIVGELLKEYGQE